MEGVQGQKGVEGELSGESRSLWSFLRGGEMGRDRWMEIIEAGKTKTKRSRKRRKRGRSRSRNRRGDVRLAGAGPEGHRDPLAADPLVAVVEDPLLGMLLPRSRFTPTLEVLPLTANGEGPELGLLELTKPQDSLNQQEILYLAWQRLGRTC